MSNLILLLTFLSLGKSKESKIFPSIDSVIVYCDFTQKGYTTAGAYTQFDDFKRCNLRTEKLTEEDSKKLEEVFKKIKPRRHYQQKFGINNVFFECYVQDKIPMRKCIMGKGEGFYVFTDLTSRIEFVIKRTDDVAYVDRLLKKLK